VAVYSTDMGRLCSTCNQAVNACICKATSQSVIPSGPIRIRRESKGRGGKPVTLISGLPLASEAKAVLAKTLRKQLGVGGSLGGDDILLQGDHRPSVLKLLQKAGYEAKISGG
jgi:translation initiation factor 1